MIAVTIAVGEKYELMASMAAESCSYHTGLETHILNAAHMKAFGVTRNPMLLRYKLFDAFPDADSILHFDADMVFRRGFDPRVLGAEDHLLCVRDCYSKPFIRAAAQSIGIPARDYFNGGFLILKRRHHSRFLRLAEKYLAMGCAPFRAQCPLNWARHILDLPVTYLPTAYNHIQFQWHRDGGEAVIGHFISHNLVNLTSRQIREVYQRHATTPLTPR